jgi:hypothetical protein
MNKTWYDNCIVTLSQLTPACNKLRDEGWSVISVTFSGLVGRETPSVLMPQNAVQQVPMMVILASKMGSEDRPELINSGAVPR